MTTASYSAERVSSNRVNAVEPIIVAGSSGSLPVVITSRCGSTCACTACASVAVPAISSDRPVVALSPNWLASLPRRMSASISSTRLPEAASTAEKFADRKVLPAPGVALVSRMRLFCAPAIRKPSAVRSLRTPSSAGSSGCEAASSFTPGLPWRMARSSVPCRVLSAIVL